MNYSDKCSLPSDNEIGLLSKFAFPIRGDIVAKERDASSICS